MLQYSKYVEDLFDFSLQVSFFFLFTYEYYSQVERNYILL